VVVGDGADGVVELEVVLEGGVVAPPSHHIVGTELSLGLVHYSDIFVVKDPLFLFVFIPSSGKLKVSRIGQSVGTDRPQFRESKVVSEYFCNPSFDLSGNID
jgi:hypothetical protein